MPFTAHTVRYSARPNSRSEKSRGFSLIELICVVIIVGVLAAIAVPRYIALGTDARIAAVNTLAATLRSTAENVKAMCKLDPGCDYNNGAQLITIGGRVAQVNYGWLDAGDSLGNNEIDAWVTYTGFTASLPSPAYTAFMLNGAPDPSSCLVAYFDANYRGPVAGILVFVNTSGC